MPYFFYPIKKQFLGEYDIDRRDGFEWYIKTAKVLLKFGEVEIKKI